MLVANKNGQTKNTGTPDEQQFANGVTSPKNFENQDG